MQESRPKDSVKQVLGVQVWKNVKTIHVVHNYQKVCAL